MHAAKDFLRRLLFVPFLLTAPVQGALAPPPDVRKPPAADRRPAEDQAQSMSDPAERERRFAETLSDAVLVGTWQMTRGEGLQGKAPLTEPRPERYTIAKVSKAGDDNWVITARIEYADRDAVLPVLVRVVWAEGTPIITLDKMALPGLGTYSARVIIDGNFYAGTWMGTGYGGVLSGQIVKADDLKLIDKPRPADKDNKPSSGAPKELEAAGGQQEK